MAFCSYSCTTETIHFEDRVKITEVKTLDTPSNFRTLVNNNQITFTWNRVYDADSYHLYIADDASSDGIYIGATTETTFVYLPNGNLSHYYYVRSYNTKDFRISEPSDRVTAKPDGVWSMDSKPTYLASIVRYDGKDVTLSWNAAIDCSLYYIYQADNSADLSGILNAADAIASTSSLLAYISDLTVGQTYYFAVVGYNKSTQTFSDKSDILKVEMTANNTATTAEASVSGITVTAVTKNTIAVSWNETENASYYLVSYIGAGRRQYTVTSDANIMLTELTNSTQYNIGVATYPSSYFSQSSLYRAGVFGYITATTKGNVSTDNVAVNGIAVTKSGDALRLIWADVSGATSYTVLHSETNIYTDAAELTTYAESPFVISDVSLGETHYYWVKAFNNNGCIGVSLAAGYIPPVQNVHVSLIDNRDLTFAWDTSTDCIADSDTKQYLLYKCNSFGDVIEDVPLAVSESMPILYTPDDNESTLYFRIRGLSDVFTQYSELITFGTIDAPANLAVSQITKSSIKLTWDTVSEATEYNLYYRISSDDDDYIKVVINDYYISEYTLSDLSDDTYSIYIASTAAEGGSMASNILTVSTTLPAPENFTAEIGDSQTKINLSWNPVAGAKGYYIYYGTDMNTIADSTPIDTTATSYTLTGLIASQTYYIGVMGYDYSDEPQVSDVATAMCKTVRITPPTVSIDSYTVASVTVKWATVANADKYYVYYKKSSDELWSDDGATTALSDVLHYLKPNTSYDFMIKSYNDTYEVYSPASNIVTQVTKPLPAPTGLYAYAGTNAGEIDVSWNSAINATQYRVYYSKTNDIKTAKSSYSAATSITISGLEPAAAYYVWVKSYAEGNYSAESDSYTATAKDISYPSSVTAAKGDYYGQIKLTFSAKADGADKYIIEYYYYDAESNEVTSDMTVTASSIVPQTVVLDNLVADKYYYMKIYSYNTTWDRESTSYASKSAYARGLSTPTLSAVTSTAVPHSVKYTISGIDTDDGLEYILMRGELNDVSECLEAARYDADEIGTVEDWHLAANTTYYYFVRTYLPDKDAYSNWASVNATSSANIAVPRISDYNTPGVWGSSGSVDIKVTSRDQSVTLCDNWEVRYVLYSTVQNAGGLENFTPTVYNTTVKAVSSYEGLSSYSYTLYGLSYSTAYYFYIRGWNTVTGDEAFSTGAYGKTK